MKYEFPFSILIHFFKSLNLPCPFIAYPNFNSFFRLRPSSYFVRPSIKLALAQTSLKSLHRAQGRDGIGTGSPGNGWVLINRALACPSKWGTINLGCEFDVNLISYSCRFTTNLSLCWAPYELVGKVLPAEKVSSITHYEDIHFSSLQHRWERKIPYTSIKLRLQLARVLVVEIVFGFRRKSTDIAIDDCLESFSKKEVDREGGEEAAKWISFARLTYSALNWVESNEACCLWGICIP